MKTYNYYNKEVTFTTGQTVTYVSNESEIFTATISGITEGYLDLIFSDGDTGSELPSTCF